MIPLLMVISCGNGDSVEKVVPSDLSVNISIVGANVDRQNGDGSGLVSITAFAKNAVRYAFSFENNTLLESQSGSIEYTFTKEGLNTYTIEVLAYSKSGDSIQKSTVVEVYKSDPAIEDSDARPDDQEPSSDTLIFADEFDYTGRPDSEKWHHQIIPPNNGSWYNSELQHYTDRTENSFVSDGTLKIRALKEEYTTGGTTKSYTSARLNSKFAFTYGRIEVRAKLPAKAGTWPAIWTLGSNIDETGNYFGDQYGSVGWPACGEIDIMEQKGWDKSSTSAHFHWGDTVTGEYKSMGGEIVVSNTTTAFHIYSLEWDSSSMKVFVDEELVYELSNSTDKPYDNPHYILLNVAMGGNLGGTVPDNFTESIMEVDYVRIYQ